MRYSLVIKGTPAEAMSAARDHDISDAVVHASLEGQTVLHVSTDQDGVLVDTINRWLAEDVGRPFPLAIGALLFWNELAGHLAA